MTGCRISTPGLLCEPAALTGNLSQGDKQALPSSRATPMNTCPVLRPRWCPSLLAITQERAAAFRCMKYVGFVSFREKRLSFWTTTIHISGFNLTACILATPGSIPLITETHAGSLRTCLAQALAWSDLPCGLTGWVTSTSFIFSYSKAPSPRFGLILARSRSC